MMYLKGGDQQKGNLTNSSEIFSFKQILITWRDRNYSTVFLGQKKKIELRNGVDMLVKTLESIKKIKSRSFLKSNLRAIGTEQMHTLYVSDTKLLLLAQGRLIKAICIRTHFF